MDTINQQISEQDKTQPRFVKVSIIVAIVIVLNLFSNYLVSLVYNEPAYERFVKPEQVIEDITTKEKCLSVGGQWSESVYPNEKGKTKIEGYCNANYTNEQNYQKARSSYEKKVFVTLIIFGVILLLSAGFVAIQTLSVSFAWGGVLSLIIASIRYWSMADSAFKVIILAIALIMLIWLAVKKFNK